VQQKARIAVREDRPQLACRQAPVERHENEPCLRCSKEQREEHRRVVAKHGHAVALGEPTRFEHGSKALGLTIDVREGPGSPGGDIPEGDRIRRQQCTLAGEVGDGAHMPPRPPVLSRGG